MSKRTMALAGAVLAAAAAGGAYLLLSEPDPPGQRVERSPEAAPARPAAPPSGVPAPPLPPEAGTAPEPAGGEADGRILARVTAAGRPVEGAEVRLYRRAAAGAPEPWLAAGSGHTGGDGLLAWPAGAGSWLLSAAAPGLARTLAEALRPAGEARTVVEVRLVPGVELAGQTVERHRGGPVPFATVSLAPAGGGPRARRPAAPAEERAFATSDQRGEFRVSGLAPGRYELEARAPGHATLHLRDVAVPSAGGLRLELAAAGTIEGRVTRGGRPAGGAAVTILGPGEPVSVETGGSGAFAAEVEPGVHRIFARLGAEAGSAAGAIGVAAGAAVRGVEVRLGSPASIAGQVRSGSGPVGGAIVAAALQGDPRAGRSATTAADGSYQLEALAPASYSISVTAPGHAAAAIPAVTLRAGDRFRLDVSLRAPSAIEGLVTSLDDSPVSGALVTAQGLGRRGGPGMGLATGGATAARTDATGRFRLEDVAPGTLRVSARRDGSSPAAAAMVTVDEGETAHLDLVLVEGGVVSGTVLDSAGRPVPSATVAAAPAGRPPRFGEINQVTADAGGSYLLPLATGTYGLTAFRATATTRFGSGGRPGALATVSLTAGQSAAVNLVLPDDAPPTLSGHVLEPGGAPSAGAFVWVGALGPGLVATRADGEGAFSLAAAGGEAAQVSARSGGRAGAATATPPLSDLVIQLQPGAALHGTLLGAPPPETFTVSVTTRGAGLGGSPPDQQFAGDTFDLEDVLPGQVAVHVKTSDGRVGDAQVATSAGEAAAVTVALSPAATVTGRLVDAATGKPVTRARILVDGAASRRGGVGADGRFTRTVSAGDHQLAISALGYAQVTRPVSAPANGTADLGDIPLGAVALPGPPN